jgi:hypothetical protein
MHGGEAAFSIPRTWLKPVRQVYPQPPRRPQYRKEPEAVLRQQGFVHNRAG